MNKSNSWVAYCKDTPRDERVSKTVFNRLFEKDAVDKCREMIKNYKEIEDTNENALEKWIEENYIKDDSCFVPTIDVYRHYSDDCKTGLSQYCFSRGAINILGEIVQHKHEGKNRKCFKARRKEKQTGDIVADMMLAQFEEQFI